MKQSIIPGVLLKDNEKLTLEPSRDAWLYTLTVYTKQLGVLRTKFYMSDETMMLIHIPAVQYGFMMARMRHDIEHEVLRQVLR